MEDKNEFAYQEIKRQILSGMLTNESAISENKLVSMLDISRTPIRAALQRLQYEGFIRIIRNQGIVINELTMKEADQLCDMRIAMEQFILARSIPQLQEEDILALEENMEKQRAAAAGKNIEGLFALDTEFHQLAFKGYQNEKMDMLVRNCRERFIVYHYKSYSRQNRLLTVLEEHQRIFDAIKARDVERARNLLSEHIIKGVMAMIRG